MAMQYNKVSLFRVGYRCAATLNQTSRWEAEAGPTNVSEELNTKITWIQKKIVLPLID